MFPNLVIVYFIYKSKSKHSLFFQICFVDTGKTLSQNDTYIEEAWFHGCMFTAGTFSIILFGNNNRIPQHLRIYLPIKKRKTIYDH